MPKYATYIEIDKQGNRREVVYAVNPKGGLVNYLQNKEGIAAKAAKKKARW